MFARGRGVQRNDAEAVRLYQLAVDQKLAAAQYSLGFMYEQGRGVVERNDTEAVRLYQLAAGQGVANAQYELGRMFAQGRGVQQKEHEAVRLYQLAANKGHTAARAALKKIMPRRPARSLRKIDSTADARNEIKQTPRSSEKQSIDDQPPSSSDRLNWPWPITEIFNEDGGRGTDIGFIHKKGALKLLGYGVGKSSTLTPNERRQLLSDVFRGELPLFVEEYFPGEYGGLGSEERLKKIANAIAAFTRNAKRNDRKKYSFAIEDWEDDLEYLKEAYYDPGAFNFPWPAIED
jgi:hypothetical protein